MKMFLLFQITKKWELALQKEIPQELHEVSYRLCCRTACTLCTQSVVSPFSCFFNCV